LILKEVEAKKKQIERQTEALKSSDAKVQSLEVTAMASQQKIIELEKALKEETASS